MDNNKKQQQNYTRTGNVKACQSTDSNRKSTDLQTNKPCPKYSRRREQSSTLRNDSQRNCKQSVSAKVRPNVDKRPRPRGGGSGNVSAINAPGAYNSSACATDDFFAASTGLAAVETGTGVAEVSGAKAQNAQDYYELNSVYATGSKKQNLNHLLNFHYAPRESDYTTTMHLSMFGRGGGSSGAYNMQRPYQGNNSSGKKPRYNKEQFLQANFQFVIKSSAKPHFNSSPDTLIDWDVIEQINIQTTEEPQCPICLYPPIAAKLTRCGHAYCWPCILHYLALSDKKWRKCPICYEAIHTADLKSTTIVQQNSISVGEKIIFQLMRRKKGSMFIEKYTTASPGTERYPQVSSKEEAKLFSKFLIAKRADILNIIERERCELRVGEDVTCPEFVFIQQALDLLKERREKLGEISVKEIEESNLTVVQDVKEVKEEPKREAEVKKNTLQSQAMVTHTYPDILNTDETETSFVSSASDLISNVPTPPTATADRIKYYYFYQSVDGQNIFLHPLNVKMLQACYGTLDNAPLLINACILQKEHHSMNDEHRRKFTCLSHLPLTCQFAIVEVDLQPPIIGEGILKLFKNDLIYRKKERQRRERDERRREKQIDEINDRQMGKLIASTANLNLNSSHEFPTCGFEEPLLSIDSFESIYPASAAAIPTSVVPPTTSYSNVAVNGESPKQDFWPELNSPASYNSSAHNNTFAWGKPCASIETAATTVNRRSVVDRASESESLSELAVLDAAINLSDVLAEAISQKKHKDVTNNNSNNSKKNKRSKKMLPVFSTGMNFKGNN